MLSAPGVATDDTRGRYLAPLGTAEAPLRELAVTPLGTQHVAAMLRDLKRADASAVHGKSI